MQSYGRYLCSKSWSRTNTGWARIVIGLRGRQGRGLFAVDGRWDMAENLPSRGEIFVVDDDPAVRDTLSMVLSVGGYQVICFADGAALLSVARTRTPGAIPGSGPWRFGNC